MVGEDRSSCLSKLFLNKIGDTGIDWFENGKEGWWKSMERREVVTCRLDD